MKLRLALEEKLMDVRVRDRLLAEGKITKDDVKKHLDSLSDDEKKSVPLDQNEKGTIQ